MVSLPFLHNAPISHALLRILPEGLTHSIFVLETYMGSSGRIDGPSYHNLLAKCIDHNCTEPKDLDKWLRELFSTGLKHLALLDKACQKAEQLMRRGMWVATWQADSPPVAVSCPQVLFGHGNSHWDWPWITVFNSRKSKLVKPHEKWLAALRSWLPELSSLRTGIATSFGTLTYDLLAAYAKSAGIPLLIVSPVPLADTQDSKTFPFSDGEALPYLVLTCQTKTMKCPKPTRMVCRDRLLAFLADIHWVLEVRAEGNLQRVLHAQHEKQRRDLMILRPNDVTRTNRENFRLLEAFPSAEAVSVSVEDALSAGYPASELKNMQTDSIDGLTEKTTKESIESVDGAIPAGKAKSLHCEAVSDTSESRGIEWQNYLYHYTRSCPGPWPDQSYQQYLLSLLRNERFCGHTALDTLIRILLEGKIRASKKLVRGEQAVVSWSAVPPIELQKLRQWNPALIRWTFEPYGIAIHRELAKGKGVKPVIYCRDGVFAQLRHSARFRYQRHEPPNCSWKHEREWRLAGDFDLAWVSTKNGFIFVHDPADLEVLNSCVQSRLPVFILAGCSFARDGQK